MKKNLVRTEMKKLFSIVGICIPFSLIGFVFGISTNSNRLSCHKSDPDSAVAEIFFQDPTQPVTINFDQAPDNSWVANETQVIYVLLTTDNPNGISAFDVRFETSSPIEILQIEAPDTFNTIVSTSTSNTVHRFVVNTLHDSANHLSATIVVKALNSGETCFSIKEDTQVVGPNNSNEYDYLVVSTEACFSPTIAPPTPTPVPSPTDQPLSCNVGGTIYQHNDRWCIKYSQSLQAYLVSCVCINGNYTCSQCPKEYPTCEDGSCIRLRRPDLPTDWLD